jgi:putative transposase
VIDFVHEWQEKSEMKREMFIKRLGITRSKYYAWEKHYGKENFHNGLIPRDYWLLPSEREAIIKYYLEHSRVGYRALTYMMLDADVVAVSPATTYRVLKSAGLMRCWNGLKSKKGTGFEQPLNPHEHWHTDVSYINICGTFYYFIGVLDGCSRYLVAWDIRESMKEIDIEVVLQKARESFPDARPRIISDNGSAYISKEFKNFIKISGMTHVKTSPFYPQSNGKMERFNGTLKVEAIRPNTPVSLDDAKTIVSKFVEEYNNQRLHCALGYITPNDRLNNKQEEIFRARDSKLEAARAHRKLVREGYPSLTNYNIEQQAQVC